MSLPTVLTGSTYCQEEKAKGKCVFSIFAPWFAALREPRAQAALQLCCWPLLLPELHAEHEGVTPPPAALACAHGLVLPFSGMWGCLPQQETWHHWHPRPRCPWLIFRSHAETRDRGVLRSCLGCCGLLQVFAQSTNCFQVGFPKGNAFHHFLSQLSLVVF